MTRTIDDLLKYPIFMSGGINALSSFISDPFSRIFGAAGGQDPQIDNGSSTVPSSFGYELGSIVDMNFFPTDKFTEPQLDLIDHSDSVSKRIHIGDSRSMGGPYEAHVIDMLKSYFEIAGRLGTPLDYRMAASIIIHDVKEDFEPIKELSRRYKELRKRAHDEGSSAELDIKILKDQIRAARAKLGIELRQNQLEAINAIGDRYKLAPNEIAALGIDGAVILSVVEWVTRHTEARYFFQSMYILHQMHNYRFYANMDTGDPSQVEAMKSLGVTKGLEPLDYFLMRVALKAFDRIALSTERSPRFTPAQARELEGLMQKYPALQKTYGDIKFRGDEMPRPYNLNIAYRNFIILQNIALALRSVKQRAYNMAAHENLQLIKGARTRLLYENKRILDELETSYERDLGKKESGALRSEIERDAKAYPASIDRITGKGPISRGTELDTVYQDRWAELDATQHGMAQNFMDVLILQRLQERFADQARNVINLPHDEKPTIRLFYIKGLTDSLLMHRWNPHP